MEVTLIHALMLFCLCTVLPICIPVTLPRMANQNFNRLLNLGKWMDMINDVTSPHQDCRPGCRGPLQGNLKSEDRRGLATRMVILCTSCGYISWRYTLYEEVETKSPGRNKMSKKYDDHDRVQDKQMFLRRVILWYGMVWYGMLSYAMVWYGKYGML